MDISLFVWNGRWVMASKHEVLLTPAEVASLFRVHPKTVTRWAKSGKLSVIKTLGGHRRYKDSEVKALMSTISSLNDLNGGK